MATYGLKELVAKLWKRAWAHTHTHTNSYITKSRASRLSHSIQPILTFFFTQFLLGSNGEWETQKNERVHWFVCSCLTLPIPHLNMHTHGLFNIQSLWGKNGCWPQNSTLLWKKLRLERVNEGKKTFRERGRKRCQRMASDPIDPIEWDINNWWETISRESGWESGSRGYGRQRVEKELRISNLRGRESKFPCLFSMA